MQIRPEAINRVILIVLDSVGAGELPDAASYGDQGSNTLGNIARQVPLRCRRSGRWGCPRGRRLVLPHPAGTARRVRTDGRNLTGKDSVTGHWELMGLVLDRPFPVFPRWLSGRADRRVPEAHSPGHDRQQGSLRNRHHRRVRPGTRTHRQAHRLHVRRQRLPDRGARRRRAAAGALSLLRDRLRTGRERVGRRPRHRQAFRRSGRQLHENRQPT